MARRTLAGRAVRWVGVLLLPLAAGAQPRAGDGYMFGAPGGSFTVRAGVARPREGSDLFSFVRHELTLDRGAFTGGAIGADLAFFMRPRLALQLGWGLSDRTAPSVYRKWIDNDDKEIEQSSSFRRMPISMGLRYYLTPPGRSLGRLAWVPSRVATYASAGGGITWYQFRQTGDFVDYQTLDVFGSTLVSDYWAPSAFAAAGVEYALGARYGLTGEARYDYARAAMSSDFDGFSRIDLSGVAVTIGLTVRF